MTPNPTQDADALLAELNGSAAKPDPDALPAFVAGDEGAQVPGQSRTAELEVPLAPKPSPARAADAVHSTAAGGSGYKVKVAGEYFAADPASRGKVKKPYEAEFNVARLEGCLSLIKNRLLKQTLLKKYPDFVADRTCYIVSQQPLGPNVPKSRNLAFMNREDLEGFAKTGRIPVDLGTFEPGDHGTAELRESVIDFVQNPDPVRPDAKGVNTVRPGDPGTFLARETLRQAKRAEDRELRALNPGLDVGA